MSAAALLSNHSHKPRPEQPFLGNLSLPLARVHEICGNSRHTLAMIIAGRMQGPVFWISPGWQPGQLNPEGMVRFAQPGRFTFIRPRRPEDLLWVLEETLRSGTVPLAVAELPAPPGLTPVRRLHLAAETGAAEGRVKPLGLILTAGDGGAQGVETRWRMVGDHQSGNGWLLTRARARTQPVQSWRVEPQHDSFRLIAPPDRTEPDAGHSQIPDPHQRADPARAPGG